MINRTKIEPRKEKNKLISNILPTDASNVTIPNLRARDWLVPLQCVRRRNRLNAFGSDKATVIRGMKFSEWTIEED